MEPISRNELGFQMLTTRHTHTRRSRSNDLAIKKKTFYHRLSFIVFLQSLYLPFALDTRHFVKNYTEITRSFDEGEHKKRKSPDENIRQNGGSNRTIEQNRILRISIIRTLHQILRQSKSNEESSDEKIPKLTNHVTLYIRDHFTLLLFNGV